MAHQVFISYSSRDEAVAREVVDALEAENLACWISCRDIRAGQNYQESIVRAIRGAQVLVLLFSAHANASREVLKELSVAGGFSVPVLPLRLARIAPAEGLIYELSTCQWIDGWPDRELALARLMTSILELVGTIIAARPPRPRDDATIVTRAAVAPAPATSAPVTATLPRSPSFMARRPSVTVSDSALAALQDLLTWHVGPIARTLIRRARAEAVTIDDLCERLAAHMPGNAERDAFLRQAQECLRR